MPGTGCLYRRFFLPTFFCIRAPLQDIRLFKRFAIFFPWTRFSILYDRAGHKYSIALRMPLVPGISFWSVELAVRQGK